MGRMHFFLIVFLFSFHHHFLECSYTLKHLPYYSQNGEDKFIYESFFEEKNGGFFVEIGAHDGISYSNTAFFEKNLGWNGICFEPHPEKFKELTVNRACTCLNKAVGKENGFLDFLQINGAPEMLSGLINHYDPQHLNRIDFELSRDGGSTKIIQVECIKLEEILKNYGINHIDILSIDTEGNEYEILSSINLRKIYVDIVVVENNYNDKKINILMKKNFYKLVKTIDGNQVYKNLRKGTFL